MGGDWTDLSGGFSDNIYSLDILWVLLDQTKTTIGDR